MTLAKLSVLMSLLLVIRPGQQQQQCSIDSLPPFGDTGNKRPDRDRFQAIVPAYTFQCSGRVTEWMACVHHNRGGDQYYIQFQVWRPNGTTGCYSLVGYNHPLDNDGMESYLVAINDNNSPLDNCVVLPVEEEDEQIEVQSGDVVGYYVDSNGHDNGIQWIEEDDNDYIDDVVVYYEDNLTRESIKSHYGVGINPTECDFVLPANDDTNSYFISTSTSAVPIISFSIATIIPTSSPPHVPFPLPPVISPPLLTDSSVPPVSAPSQTVDSPPSNLPNDSQSTDRTGLIIGIVFIIIIFVIVLSVGGIIIIVLIKRKKNDKISSTKPFDNPAYQETAGQLSLKPPPTNQSQGSTTSSVQYDYCTVPEVTGTQLDERVYATVENGESNYHSVDYTTVYDDPTSLSYVSEVYSSGSVFDTAGTCVPTLEHRSMYESAGSPLKYNTLQFFERDPVYWAPASTTLGLYEQLCTKRYREINRNQIRILETIGSGQFGTVSKGVWRYKNETMQVAVKILTNTASEVERVKFLQEAAIMGQFYHPNIVRLHGVVTVGDPVLIVLDFMPNGDMKSYLDHLVIRSNDQTIFPRIFLKYCREIAAGMAYLAKKSFVHRDLAARNILLDDRMSCKVGDFGMARDLMDDTYYKSKGGKIPVKWTAPEALLYKKFSTTSDVWSYAMVLYEIWSVGNKPFQNLSNSDVIPRLQNHKCLAPPPGCPREVYSLMVDCWNPEPHLRPTFDTAFHVLRRPEELLLHWSEEDVSAGRHLLKAKNTTHSFADLQNKYV